MSRDYFYYKIEAKILCEIEKDAELLIFFKIGIVYKIPYMNLQKYWKNQQIFFSGISNFIENIDF